MTPALESFRETLRDTAEGGNVVSAFFVRWLDESPEAEHPAILGIAAGALAPYMALSRTTAEDYTDEQLAELGDAVEKRLKALKARYLAAKN